MICQDLRVPILIESQRYVFTHSQKNKGKERSMVYGISVVVPVYNEEGNIAKLHKEIVDACEGYKGNGEDKIDYEILFINDGSVDRTKEICRTLRPVKLINMRMNFGQTAAMDAGI